LQRPEDFWDERFTEEGLAYGAEPNDFVREVADRIPGGRVLCLAEGQGRNAVHLAGRGLEVTAMDQSPVGIARAEALARERGVRIATVIASLEVFVIEREAWDGIVSVFAHLPPRLRRRVHRAVADGLRPGGAFVLEAYAPRQLEFGTGGPQDAERLAGVETLVGELAGLEFEIAREVERDVIEGRYHTGRAATVQILARRPRG
jgi:SAM-dependent methyltransferase